MGTGTGICIGIGICIWTTRYRFGYIGIGRDIGIK